MKKSMLLTLIAISLVPLSGCTSFNPEMFENRASCAIAGDKAFVNSMYGPVGITSVISPKDTVHMCKPPTPTPK